jgi:putative transcriptional regulator
MSIILLTVSFDAMGNAAILKELGDRFRRERLNRNLSQSELAAKAGLSRRTIVGAETGDGPTLETVVSMLRALGLLNHLEIFLPLVEISPVQLAKLKGKQRQRASRSKNPNEHENISSGHSGKR